MKNQFFKYSLICVALTLIASCKKLEFEPENSTRAEDVYKTKEDFKNVLNSCYDLFGNQMNGTVQNFNELLGDNLSGIQIANTSLEYFAIYSRGTISFRTGDCFEFYQGIYRANVLLEKLKEQNPGFTDTEVSEIEAECRFLRAWMHWEMVKLYAQPYDYTSTNTHPGIPLRLKSEYVVEIRSSVKEVYDQILTDLKVAEENLPLTNGNYANKTAAQALLAKVYFQMHDYEKAWQYSDMALANGSYTLSDSLNRFAPGASSEVIFKIVSQLSNNKSGILVGNYRSDQNPNPPFKISKEIIDKMVNDTTDKRQYLYKVYKANTAQEYWVTNKFNRDVFDIPLLTLTDLYLVRAESQAERGNINEAYTDLMKIRERAHGIGNRTFDPNGAGVNLMDSIRLERRLEFIAEGDRVQQLKRMGSQGENVKIRNAPWNCPGMILQFPASFKTAGFEFNIEGGCN
ncbi:MAG: RagB/SusD family nutrient uptake outer membrane protein [Flavobacteriales bacterium]|nr:RagB/SusD family nutrient uptake outer membrane protein [Flavobacteriales bacterium]